eukprot:TRINITY_DN2022_c0_g1_i1.p2 TRINITY_DN2022_c0_g1~~TRINITY_DN2022_c0_g1_i1.p2  ORF type:complete len:151 (-),score=24.29 TRINITY_DN2022_c0_g1_i1:38-490(-)
MLRFFLPLVVVAFIAVCLGDCGGPCVTNDDCATNQTATQPCPFCMFGSCGAGCGQACSKRTDCRDPNCPSCDVLGTKTCGGGCGSQMKCKENSDCRPAGPLKCQYCNTKEGQCESALPCGSPCKTDDDCYAGGGHGWNCGVCNQTKCMPH